MTLKWTYDSEADDSFSYKGDFERTLKCKKASNFEPVYNPNVGIPM